MMIALGKDVSMVTAATGTAVNMVTDVAMDTATAAPKARVVGAAGERTEIQSLQ